MVHRVLDTTSKLFDAVNARWESPRVRRATGTGLVLLFLGALTLAYNRAPLTDTRGGPPLVGASSVTGAAKEPDG